MKKYIVMASFLVTGAVFAQSNQITFGFDPRNNPNQPTFNANQYGQPAEPKILKAVPAVPSIQQPAYGSNPAADAAARCVSRGPGNSPEFIACMQEHGINPQPISPQQRQVAQECARYAQPGTDQFNLCLKSKNM